MHHTWRFFGQNPAAQLPNCVWTTMLEEALHHQWTTVRPPNESILARLRQIEGSNDDIRLHLRVYNTLGETPLARNVFNTMYEPGRRGRRDDEGRRDDGG